MEYDSGDEPGEDEQDGAEDDLTSDASFFNSDEER